MQTLLSAEFRATPEGHAAEDILRSCVRCGFCTASCPTYQLTGNELDGPRGRIQLIKQVLEGQSPSAHTQLHLDRCLTCRACEPACPSGVRYGELLEIGRAAVAARVPRPWPQRLQRALLRTLLTHRALVPLHRLARPLRAALPRRLAAYLRPRQFAVTRRGAAPAAAPQPATARQVLLLAGCVQRALAPDITRASTRVLARLGIQAIVPRAVGCCGAVRQHLDDPRGALDEARRAIDAWWPHIAQGAVAILSDNSACSIQLGDYGRLLAHDPRYQERAARVSALATDIGRFLAGEQPRLQPLLPARPPQRLAFQAPCSLQHGLRSSGQVEGLLRAAGALLAPVAEPHLCCGSAGSYALLQPELSGALRARKLAALAAGAPVEILSANVGCIAHLAAGASVPVRHWIQWLDERMGESA